MSNICCLFNIATHYRAPIYKQMDKELHCDFYIGDAVPTPLKRMNYHELMGMRKELNNIYLGKNVIWQKGAIKTIFKGYKNYIITGEPACLSTWIILMLARLTSKRTFLWTHGWYGRESGLKKIVKKLFFGLSNQVLLYGDYARNLMLREGFKSEKLHCIYNSLDYNLQYEIRKSVKHTEIYFSKFNNNDPVLCYIGRIQKNKQIDMIIESMVILKNKYNMDVNFIIVGQEIEDTGIAELVRKNDLNDKVWFYGPCYVEEKLAEIFYNSNLCVSPGNVGLTAIHSLTYGCPVITHNFFPNQGPEFEAITKGVTGDFFKKNSVDDLADKINNWLICFPENDDKKRNDCYEIIDEKYNPHFQISLLKSLLT